MQVPFNSSYSTRLMKKIKPRNPTHRPSLCVHCFPFPWLHSSLLVNLHRRRRVCFGKCFCFVFVSDFLPAPAKNSATFNCASSWFCFCFAVFSNFARFFNLHASLGVLFCFICCYMLLPVDVYERSTF